MAKTDKEILMSVLESMGEPAAIRGYVIAAVEEAIRMTREDADYEEEDEDDWEEDEDDVPECGDCGTVLSPTATTLCGNCDIEICNVCAVPQPESDSPVCSDCADDWEDEELVIGDDEPKDQAV